MNKKAPFPSLPGELVSTSCRLSRQASTSTQSGPETQGLPFLGWPQLILQDGLFILLRDSGPNPCLRPSTCLREKF